MDGRADEDVFVGRIIHPVGKSMPGTVGIRILQQGHSGDRGEDILIQEELFA